MENMMTSTVAATVTVSTPSTIRRFYKCGDCLAVMATTEDVRTLDPECSCGGKLKFMGRVERAGGSLLDSHYQSACDGRCTNAPGPSCDCSCGGKNHGTHRLVEVVREIGKAPRLVSPNPERAEEFRAAKAAALKAFDAANGFVYTKAMHGEMVGRVAVFKIREVVRAINTASRKPSHSARMLSLEAVRQLFVAAKEAA